MDRNIEAVIVDRVAKAPADAEIICGNSDYTITFTFDDEWEGIEVKTALFKWLTADGVRSHEQPFTGDVVAVPILTDTREVVVGVYAGNLTTTTGAPIRCVPSIRCGAGEKVEPDPDKYDALMELIKGGGLAGESAYEAAVAQGYDGTKEEFGEGLAKAASGGGSARPTAEVTLPDVYFEYSGKVATVWDYDGHIPEEMLGKEIAKIEYKEGDSWKDIDLLLQQASTALCIRTNSAPFMDSEMGLVVGAAFYAIGNIPAWWATPEELGALKITYYAD